MPTLLGREHMSGEPGAGWPLARGRRVRTFRIAAIATAAMIGVAGAAYSLSTLQGPATVSKQAVRVGIPTDATPNRPSVFVAVSGSDRNIGTIGHPYRTIAYAASVAPPGTDVVIGAGYYAGFDVVRSGLVFRSRPGEKVVVSDADRDDVIQFTGVTSGGLDGLVIEGSTAQYGSGVKIKESSGVFVTNSLIRDHRTFGVVIVRSSDVEIRSNEISGNAAGVEERYAGDGVRIVGNQIHDNTKMVDAGRGREGINFYKSTGKVLVANNVLHDNGTHLEVYGASNLTITGNLMWSGQIMETGTDGLPCHNNRFVRNVGYRGPGFPDEYINGMIMRCASDNLIAHNTLDGFDKFAIDIVDGTQDVAYGGSIDGLRILNNVLVGGRAYSIDNQLPSSVEIDWNLIDNDGSTALYGNHLAYVAGVGQFDTLGEFRAATGHESHGISQPPGFVDRAGRDYRLAAGSAAVDRGTVVLDDGYTGSKPDLGSFERG